MELIQRALDARSLAYAPYSKFMVGCAVEMTSGRVFTGANVENCSYGACICAERVAITHAVSQGDKAIKRLAIVSSSPQVVAPCGICLQVIREFGPTAEIICADKDGKNQKVFSCATLLPQGFDPSLLP